MNLRIKVRSLLFLQHVNISFNMKKLNYSSKVNIPPETLLFRFYKFISQSPKYKRYVVSKMNNSDMCKTYQLGNLCDYKSLADLTISDIQGIVIYLGNKKHGKKLADLKKPIRILDKICCEKISSASAEDTMKLNYAWLILLGLHITRLQSFTVSLQHLRGFLDENTPQFILLMLFYAGFAKKSVEAKAIFPSGLTLLSSKEILQELSVLEVMLVVNTMFKSGTKVVDPSFLKQFLDMMNKDLRKYIADPAVFVTFVKTLRHSKFIDYKLLKDIEICYSRDKNLFRSYNFTAKVHILALYADALYGEHGFLSDIINSITSNMLRTGSYRPYQEKSTDKAAGSIRAKDLARLLWASSYLGFKLDENLVKKNIVPIILNKCQHELYNKRMEVLVDSVLSLWIMGFKPIELLPHVFSKKTTKYMSESSRIRYTFRHQLLFTCVSIEAPEVLNTISAETWPIGKTGLMLEKTTKQSEGLLNVLHIVMSVSWRFGLNDIKCDSAVPNLNIPGIMLKSDDCCKSDISIEVLDDSNCLHQSDIPNGLMLLKLRLLRKLEYKVILVNYHAFRSNDSHLMNYLEDELNKMS